ncbi:hypothetical protein NLI96_g11773 [Meripilus lineatus]|uniref:Uncharacterized protein n=1 Tax=Meripilus lineatus TaxID=2056292 RepID=A0AAD5YAJ3_9APHY|nr:hypothetical protein NLI96_g11773 [Physisporinus lineatus]
MIRTRTAFKLACRRDSNSVTQRGFICELVNELYSKSQATHGIQVLSLFGPSSSIVIFGPHGYQSLMFPPDEELISVVSGGYDSERGSRAVQWTNAAKLVSRSHRLPYNTLFAKVLSPDRCIEGAARFTQ